MKNIKLRPVLIIFALSFVFFVGSSADARIWEYVETEFQTSAGYTDNLLADSSAVEDSYGLGKVSAKFYPLPIAEILLNGEYTNYGNYVDLTNYSGGVGITVIPLKENSRFSIYINGNFNSRGYRENFESFNTRIYDGIASLGYSVSPIMQLRAGFSLKSTSYLHVLAVDNTKYEIFGGVNTSFLGKNSFDLQMGYAFVDLTYWEKQVWHPPDISGAQYVLPERTDEYPPTDGHLKLLQIWPRYSRPIGDKFAIVINYSYRKFDDLGEIAVAGVTTQSLSPWASIYEGESISFTLKSFFLPNFILESGVGYWKKNFLNSNENRNVPLLAKYIILARHDEQNKAYLTIKRPFQLKSGLFIEPTVTINHTYNNSTNAQYDYTNLSISGGITFRY